MGVSVFYLNDESSKSGHGLYGANIGSQGAIKRYYLPNANGLLIAKSRSTLICHDFRYMY